MNETTLIYSIDLAEDCGVFGTPQEIIQELGIVFTNTAWLKRGLGGPNPRDEKIKLNGVDPDTVPDPLPPYLTIVED